MPKLELFVVERIDAARWSARKKAVEYRVKWLGYSPRWDTWEPKVSFDNGASIYLLDEWWERVQKDSGFTKEDVKRIQKVDATVEHKDEQTRATKQLSLSCDREATPESATNQQDADMDALAELQEKVANADHRQLEALAGLRETLSPLSDM